MSYRMNALECKPTAARRPKRTGTAWKRAQEHLCPTSEDTRSAHTAQAAVILMRGLTPNPCPSLLMDSCRLSLGTSLQVGELSNRRGKKQAVVNDFVPSQVDPGTVKYLDKAREKQRQRNLKRKAEMEDQGGQAAAQAVGTESKRTKLASAARTEQLTPATKEARMSKAQRMRHKDEDAEMLAEYRMLRKVEHPSAASIASLTPTVAASSEQGLGGGVLAGEAWRNG
eukprot:scaffold706_cov418-Prasinococcus_capsulatus_cf.AAC.36